MQIDAEPNSLPGINGKIGIFAIRFPCRPRRFQGTFIEIMGPTGFDSEISGDVSMPSAGIQLVNLMTQLL